MRAVGILTVLLKQTMESRNKLGCVFLFLDDDHAGHAYGFEMGVENCNLQLEELDNQMGTILSAIKRDTFDEESWKIVFTSDHGGYHVILVVMPVNTLSILVVGRDVEQGRLPLSTSILDGSTNCLTMRLRFE